MILKAEIVNNPSFQVTLIKKEYDFKIISSSQSLPNHKDTLLFTLDEFQELVLNEYPSEGPHENGVWREGDYFVIVKDFETISLHSKDFKLLVSSGERLLKNNLS